MRARDSGRRVCARLLARTRGRTRDRLGPLDAAGRNRAPVFIAASAVVPIIVDGQRGLEPLDRLVVCAQGPVGETCAKGGHLDQLHRPILPSGGWYPPRGCV